jgi:putative membrane protein
MWGFGMGIMMLIFWAAVVVGIIVLVRWLWGQGKGGLGPIPGRESPLDIAKRRYASGEINKEEFEQLKRDLM